MLPRAQLCQWHARRERAADAGPGLDVSSRQIGEQIVHRRVASLRRELQAAHERALHASADTADAHAADLVLDEPGRCLGGGAAREQPLAGEELVEARAERELIRARVD